MAFSCMECMRRFSQIVLIIINIIVVLLGLATMAIGIWAKVNDRTYFQIANNQSIAQLSILLIIVGVFIMIVGAVGAIGAIFGNTIFGRITLGLYSVVLGLLVICEIAAGIAAAIKRNELENAFRNGAKETFNSTNGTKEWNTYEEQLHCCGPESWKDYRTFFNRSDIPVSCCNPADSTRFEDCKMANSSVRNDPSEETANDYFFQTGCASVVIDGVRHNLGAIAGGAIVLGLVQIAGIVMACFVAVYKRDDNKYEVV